MPKLIAQPRPIGAAVLALAVVLCIALAAPAASLAAPGPIALKVTPSPVAFGKTTVGEKSLLEVEIGNEGEEASIEKIAIEGGDSGDFSSAGNTCGPLAEGQHCAITLEFKPGSLGAKQTTGFIRFVGGGRSDESFEINGTAVGAHLSFTPPSHDFGIVETNSGSVGQGFQLENDGEAAVQVGNVELAANNGFFFDNNPNNVCSRLMQPGESCSFQVYFGPNNSGPYSDQLRANAGGEVFTAGLSGEGARPEVEVTPNPVDFGAATVGSTGVTRAITVTNSGKVPTGFFIAVVSGGDAGSFRLLDESCTGTELQPGSSCTAHVRFAPLAAGNRKATFSIFGDGEGGVQVQLRGEGVDPALSISPASFDFGSQAKDSHGPAHSFAVRNNGGTPVQLVSASIVGADLDQFGLVGDTCSGALLAAGQECVVRVRFAPEETGQRTASLRVVGDAVSLTSALSGAGAAKPPAVPRVAFHWRGVGQKLRGGRAISVGSASCKVAKRCDITVTTQLKITRHPRPGLVETQLANLPKTSIRLSANRSRAIEVGLPPAVRELLDSGRAKLLLKAGWTADDKAGNSSSDTAIR